MCIRDSRRPDTVAHQLRRAAVSVGVEISPHDLRHFAATQMVAAGIPIDSVARRLHHKDPALTLRTYAHPSAVDERRAGEAVSRALMSQP